MPTVTLNTQKHEETSLYTCKFNSFVQVTHVTQTTKSLLGRICLWTTDQCLIPLDDPYAQIHVRNTEEENKVRVRYLTEGEVLTIKF